MVPTPLGKVPCAIAGRASGESAAAANPLAIVRRDIFFIVVSLRNLDLMPWLNFGARVENCLGYRPAYSCATDGTEKLSFRGLRLKRAWGQALHFHCAAGTAC